MDKLREIGQYILAEIGKRDATGSCSVGQIKKSEIYYESGKISMVRTVFSESIGIKVLLGKQKGTISLNRFDKESIDRAVDEAIAAAKEAKHDEAEGLSEVVDNRHFEYGVLEADLDRMYDRFAEYLEDSRREYPLISYDSAGIEHNLEEGIYMNTNGVELSEKNGSYAFSAMFMAVDGDNVSSFNFFGDELADLDKPLLEIPDARRNLEETERQVRTEQFNGKFVGDIILPPRMFNELLYYAVMLFTSDSSLINKTSIWKDKLGEKVVSDKLTLRIEPTNEALIGRAPVTGDGYPARDFTLIDKGVLKSFMLSRYAAAKTGNDRAPGDNLNCVVEAGDTSLEAMIRGVDKGIVMNRFSGGSPSPDGNIAGIAKNSFMVRDGEVAEPLSEVMVSFNIAEALNNIKFIGEERFTYSDSILPWAVIENVTISGK